MVPESHLTPALSILCRQSFIALSQACICAGLKGSFELVTQIFCLTGLRGLHFSLLFLSQALLLLIHLSL